MIFNKKRWIISLLIILILIIIILFLSSSDIEKQGQRSLRYQPPQGDERVKHDHHVLVHTVYVPVYSHVYFGSGEPYLLTITLAVRNTDLDREILIRSIKYYDTDGKLVRNYLANPLKLNALASKEVLVEEHDIAGGVGAKFIVEWVADETVESPVIEAIMIGGSDLRGISFTTTGKEISLKEVD
ncbi:MAG: DUF3124 domain-containing protein [Deltaproteobacteria bacterium]|nr:DUF3124 domain-containing protein [Deltaproteobacteria bacterium]